jgi:multidrug efflux pump subunit AcrB
MNPRILLAAVLALVVGAFGFKLLDQGQQIGRLTAEVEALRAELQRLPSPATPQPSAAPTRPPANPLPQPSAARVPLSGQEIARVESAVMSLLEADRPELREKLRSVVQEQQQSLAQAQREQRRERWVARRESKLLELGLSAEQRQAVLQIMLATRDQISDVQRSAEGPQAIAGAREKARNLREQSRDQIRGLLSSEQYRAYRETFEQDDEDDKPPAAPQ